ncbi:hypothetical protein CASFOL_002885 [Castilleja foliolosa]|uniref:Clp R domain-containing protein n=1 Tax=Castilleja foliolosa TaxID=1961234 RepID=A0ABD3EG43_9LAMI
MPTPVDVARQCLAESAASVLDDAVAVAKRRSHAQTTSLHIISALLALPSSTLREACTRTRSSAYAPRLQFRALELCVGVALDRVSVSKSSADEPPVSNSLMAAIKRSQANQRRHPETFHLYQQQLDSNSQNPPSICSVKVEMKHFVMSILDDPIVSRVLGDAGFQTHEIKMAILNPLVLSRFSSTSSRPPPPTMFSNFPFANPSTEKADDNSRRIIEILSKSSRKNPLLIGAYASDAHRNFVDCLKNGGIGVLPKEIDGLSLVSIEHEISEFFRDEKEEAIGLKFKHVDEMVKDCQGPGIILNGGDLKVFVDAESVNAVNHMVLELKKLVIKHGKKLWFICFLGGDGDYKKLVERLPSIQMDLDLHLLPITTGDKCFKSSLLRSFVPLGGFFSMPSENGSLTTTAAKPSRLCNSCNEKYEREASDISKGVSTNSVADKASTSLSSWLQIAERETSKRSLTAEAKIDKSVLDARVMVLKRKWSDICQRLHPCSTSPEDRITKMPSFKDAAGLGPLLLNTPIVSSGRVNTTQTKMPGRDLELNDTVTTNLRLGTLYNPQPSKNYELISSSQVSQSSSWSHHNLEKKPWALLAEKVYWQAEAIQTISQTVSRCRNRNGNIWMSLVGPDKVGKKKIASEAAEIVFSSKEKNFMPLDLDSGDANSAFNSVLDCYYESNCHKLKMGRKMIVDYLAEELRKHPHSVVLLENVDKADFLVQNSLSQAIKTGKFSDSHGRVININNNVFFLQSTSLKATEVAPEYPEDEILQAKNLQMQILVESADGNYPRDFTTNVSVTPIKTIPTHKRKRGGYRSSRSIIDLNLPVEDIDDNTESEDENDDSAWLDKLLGDVDENVVFKPFDFDSLSQKILKDIDTRLKKSVWLEIDREVMVQILAAAWVTDEKNAVEDWIERVLFSGLEEARRRCGVSCDLVMKLVQCDGLSVEGWAAGICLPARINII